MAKEGEREHRSENNDKNRERSRFYTTLKPFYYKDLNLNYFASANHNLALKIWCKRC